MKTTLISRVVAAVRHQWLLVASILIVGTIAAVVAALSAHQRYTATTTVLMVAEPLGASNLIPTTTTKPLLSTDLPSLATDPTVVSRLRADLGETASYETLLTRIHAKVGPESTVMPVQYTAGSSARAIQGANALGDEIVRFYRTTATTRFDSLIADFQSQLATRGVELTRLDGELTASAKSYPYIDVIAPGAPTNQGTSVYGRLVTLQSQRAELQAVIASDAAAAQATHRLIADAKPLAERDVVNSDTAYRNLRDQYARDFSTLKKLNAYGSDRYPGIVELRRTVERESASVGAARRNAMKAGPESNVTYVAALDAQTKADSQYLSDQAKLQAQTDELNKLQSQIGAGRLATDVARIRREHDNSEAAYTTIATRLAKAITDRAEAASTGSVIILDYAQYAPKAAFAGGTVLAIGIMLLTAWLALTVAVMIDGSQEWFRDARTVEAIYGTKLIGSLA